MGRGQGFNFIAVLFIGLALIALLAVGLIAVVFPPPAVPTPTFIVPTGAILPTLTPTLTPSNTHTLTPTETRTLTPTRTFTLTATVVLPTIAPTRTLTPSITPSFTLTPSLTFTPSLTPSDTPIPSITPSFTITPSLTITDTLVPSLTFTPSRTPTTTPVRITQQPTEPPPSPFPFALRENGVRFQQNTTNSAGCLWQGFGGQVFGIDGQPLTGIPVHVYGSGIDVYTISGSNTIYGAAGWEIAVGNTISTGTYVVELQSPNRTIISQSVPVTFPGDCARNLAIVEFQQTRPF